MPISILHPQRHGPRRAMPLSLSKRIFAKLSNETRFTGLSFEKAAARCIARRARLRRTLRTFASRAVFSPTYTPPEKMISIFFALASANSARLPCAIAKCRCKKYPAGKTPAGYGIYRYSMAMTLLFGSCFFAAFGREICRMPFSNFARMSSGSTCSPT